MNATRFRTVARRLAAAPPGRDARPASDAELLGRFLDTHNEPAFEDLVLRHLPAVRAVCRSVLRDPNDADDAVQATFLVLVRRAGAVRDRRALGAWLCRVAWRAANRLRGMNARRNTRTSGSDPDTLAGRADAPAGGSDVRAVLHDEIARLPERYRLAVLTCYAAGTPTAEAAVRLGWPKGTLLTRLAWARKRLRDRLTRRGVTLAGGFTAVFAGHAGSAGGSLLAGRVVGSAVTTLSGDPAAKELVSERVSSLTEGVVRAMIGTKIKLAVAVGFVVVALLGLGLGRMSAGAADAADKKLTFGSAPTVKAAEPKEPVATKPQTPDAVDPLVADARVVPAGPGADLVVRRPLGSFTREVAPFGKATLTFTEDRLHIHASVQIDKVSFTVDADADYALNRESVVYGIITAVDVSGLPRDAELEEIALLTGAATDMPFAFRVRVEDDSIAIKDVKIGPFGSPLLAQAMSKNGDHKEDLFVLAAVSGKYKADPNPDRNTPSAAPKPRKK